MSIIHILDVSMNFGYSSSVMTGSGSNRRYFLITLIMIGRSNVDRSTEATSPE